MSTFDPERLFVEFREGVSPTGPLIPRQYTLTHSDQTGELFLTIGVHYAWEKTNSLRDEVLGEWKTWGNSFYFCIYLHVDQGQFNESLAAKRYETFRRELPLALTAIRYGDHAIFDAFPFLDQAPIIVSFASSYPQYAKQEKWGTFQSYQ